MSMTHLEAVYNAGQGFTVFNKTKHDANVQGAKDFSATMEGGMELTAENTVVVTADGRRLTGQAAADYINANPESIYNLQLNSETGMFELTDTGIDSGDTGAPYAGLLGNEISLELGAGGFITSNPVKSGTVEVSGTTGDLTFTLNFNHFGKSGNHNHAGQTANHGK